MHELTAVPVTLVPFLWEEVTPILQRVVDISDGDISNSTVKRRILTGTSLLITVTEKESGKMVAIFTTEIRTMDTGKRVLYAPIIAGDEMKGWLEDMCQFLHKMAIREQCSQVRGISARKGWIRALKKHGLIEGTTTVSYKL
ncbi:MAG TPA: hypothetical protein ENK70_09060 [Methylophaga sp.]|nr:hypothetical protein [Methylophaga sp.]